MKQMLIVILTIFVIFTYSITFAAHEYVSGLDTDTAAVDIVFDVLVTRPIGLVGLVSGTAVFILTLPVAAISKSIDKTSEALVKEPFKYTFTRPLGNVRGEKHY